MAVEPDPQPEWNGAKLLENANKEMPKFLHKVGMRVVADIVERMQQRGGGRAVRARGTKGGFTAEGPLLPGRKRGTTHIASAPGEPPAIDLGEYVKQIAYMVTQREGAIDLDVGVRDGYQDQARALEMGTSRAGLKHNVVILPRPHFSPAWANEMPKIRKELGIE